MKKYEIIQLLSARCGLTEVESRELYDATFVVLTETLSKNKSLSIAEFGTFETHLRKAHRYFDIFRQKIMIAPKKLTVSFHISNDFKEKLYHLVEK